MKSPRRATAAAADTAPRAAARKPPRRTRAEKALENRQRLLHAAVDVIGEHGYAGASVTRIAERAGLAQGTFYLYFESRQHLFDQLLPDVGGEALAFIRAAVGDAPDFPTMEARGLKAFFEYVARNPAYLRVFTEAEVAAPAAYARYTADRTGRFLDAIVSARRKGDVVGYSRRELGVLTQVMLAARTYLFREYGRREGANVTPPPEWVVQAYVKFVSRAIGPDAGSAEG
jgi:AcrR family transcriptional regulator